MQTVRFSAKSYLWPLLILGLGACTTTDRPDFTSMSEDELNAYNLERPLMEQVVCFVRTHTSSRIKRRQCDTIADWVHQIQQNADALVTLQPAGAGIPRAR